MITIFGAEGNIADVEVFLHQLQEFSQQEHLVIQVLNAQLVYGKDHLLSAVMHAKRAFTHQTNATNTLALEILLYAAGERQIHKAIQKMGLKAGQQTVAFVIVDDSRQKTPASAAIRVQEKILRLFGLILNDKVLEGNVDTLKHFGVTAQELKTVPEGKYGDLLLEKVAMVDIIK